MDKKITTLSILSFILLLSLSYPVYAEDGSFDIGAAMITKGLEMFAFTIGDTIFSMGMGNSSTVLNSTYINNGQINHVEAPNLIFTLLTFTIDPYSYEFVNEWQSVMIIFFVTITVLMVFMGAAVVVISRRNSDLVQPISHLFGEQVFNIRRWLNTVLTSIALLLFGTFGLYYIFVGEYAVSSLITTTALSAVPPTLDNFVIYLLFAIVYLIFSLVMAIRAIIILLMAAGALGLFALYLIPQTKEFAASAFMYFIVILFLQPTLLFISAIGLAFVKMIPIALFNFQVTVVLALVIFMAAISVVTLLGKGLTKSIVYVGSRAVL